MITLITALVSFAIAFAAGVILSKAYFSVHGVGEAAAATRRELKEQRQHYRKRIDELQGDIRDHEDTLELMRKKLGESERTNRSRPAEAGSAVKEIQRRLDIRDSEIAMLRGRMDSLSDQLDKEKCKSLSAENELGLLRVECDELAAVNQRLQSEQAEVAEVENMDPTQTGVIANLREDLGTMRESLATRDRRIHDLELQIKESESRVRNLEEKLDSWKQRVKPLTRTLKQQRNLIQEYREARVERLNEGTERRDDGQTGADNLKKIRGIGPALERRLHRHGIRRYQQIAELSEQELAEIAKHLAIAPNLAKRDQWIEQARDLAEHHATTA